MIGEGRKRKPGYQLARSTRSRWSHARNPDRAGSGGWAFRDRAGVDQRVPVFWRRAGRGVEFQDRRLPGVRQMVERPQRAGVERRGHQPLSAGGGEFEGDDAADGGDRCGDSGLAD